MAIPETEQLLSLNDARRFMPRMGGKHPSLPSVWRWCRKGIRGIRLEYVRVGRNLATSREAVSRFFNALAAADTSLDNPLPRSVTALAQSRIPSSRSASLAMADRILDRAGIRPMPTGSAPAGKAGAQ